MRAIHDPGKGLFPTTRWTLIRSAQNAPETKRAALESLLAIYWRPLYVLMRKKGLDAASAADAVQDLLLQLLRRDFLERLSPERGRLRGFLRTAAHNHLANLHAAAHAGKRGGARLEIPLDLELAERLAADTHGSPEECFDREWATGVMERALTRLREEYDSGERAGPFELVLRFFGTDSPGSYADAARDFGMALPQLKSFLHRARARYRELIRAEIAETVEEPGEIDAEMGELLGALSR